MNKAAQEVFNEIRSHIEQLNGEDLLKHLLIKLNQSNATDIEQLRKYQVWNMLLLVKWTVLHGDFTELRKFEPVEEIKLHKLLDLTSNLSDQVSEFSNFSELHLYLRKLAYQQFWLRRTESIPFGIAHQFLLFGGLPKNHSFKKRFEAIAEISIDDFIHMSTALFQYLLFDDSRILIMKEWFFAEAQRYGWNTVSGFLDSISITTEDARTWLEEYEKEKNKSYRSLAYEYFEHSPFARHPLFKHEDKYFVISPTLLLHSLSTFVHDVLREDHPSEFMDRFGKMFEKHLELSLRSVALRVLTESDLLRHFGRNTGQKVVDFLILDNGCKILVEAKGVAMRWEGMVAKLPGTIRSASKNSILKAIQQGFDLAARIAAGDTICGAQVGGGEAYLLVVTMKDFFVGSGRDYYNHIAKAEIDKIKAKFGGAEPIPLDNMFFVSADELDIILGEIAHGSWSFSQLMAAAVNEGHTYGGRPVIRQLVTQRNGDIHPPPLTQKATDELLRRLYQTLRE